MRSVPDGFLIQVLINIFYSIYIFINSVAIFFACAKWLMATKKEWGGGGRGEGGREGGEFLYIRCTGVMSFCRSAYFIIFLTAVVQRPKTLPSGPKPYKRGLMILLTPFVFRCVIFCR